MVENVDRRRDTEVTYEVLEALELREETVPGVAGRGELVFYQLGKVSQASSDFEQSYFNSAPAETYQAFSKGL